jgi:glycosyltransferase involved in cell wall biosynthesis
MIKRPVVTFVGRITGFKGPQLLLQAIPLILKQYDNVIFQFVGEGDLLEELTQAARDMGLSEDNVRFLGLRMDIPDLLRASSIAVSLSPFENFTDFALLEAMATGLPVVATDVGETRTLVKDGETGLLARPEPEDIANKICNLLEDSRLAGQLGKNARDLIVKEYSLEHFGREHERLYSSILDCRQGLKERLAGKGQKNEPYL